MPYFHVYADSKKVKELTFEEYKKLEGHGKRPLCVGVCEGRYITFRKGSNWIFIPLRQLEKTLGLKEGSLSE